MSGSHVEGMLLWPKDEPWPTCPGPHSVQTEVAVPPEFAALLKSPSFEVMTALAQQVPGFSGIKTTEVGTVVMGAEVVFEPVPSPLVPVAQLHAADVPDLRCPDGADVLQVLWCPNEHSDDVPTGPPVLVRWRAASAVIDPLDAPPAPVVASEETYLPRPCVLHPEQVTEYPWWQELPDELERQVRDFDDTRRFGENSYFSVSQAPGWKVGGYASWELTDLVRIDCPHCQQSMELLLTVDSAESGAGGSWLPVEDSNLQPSRIDPEWTAAHEPTSVSVGRHGRLRIFVCLSCPGTPIRQNLQ